MGFDMSRDYDPEAEDAFFDEQRRRWKAYRTQRNSARRRGIPFRLTFEEWMRIWEESGKWEHRGVNGYVMCRNGDWGGYEAGNVRIDHASKNLDEARTPDRMTEQGLRMRERHRDNPGLTAHLRDRERHPRGKAVIGPDGTRYASAALAAETAGISRVGMAYRARRGIGGWRYEDERHVDLPQNGY